MSKESDALARVYAAQNPSELADAYAGWAAAYDRETISLGYCLPFAIASWVARYLPTGAGPLLDAGCGTGLSGPYCAALGYLDLHGLDLSVDMLRIARGRGTYRELKHAELGKVLPWPDDHFAGFFSTGVFTAGHAPAESLDELVRITRSGGFAIFTVRDILIESGGFAEVFDRLSTSGRWRKVEESGAFRAFVLAEPDVLVKAFVFEVL